MGSRWHVTVVQLAPPLWKLVSRSLTLAGRVCLRETTGNHQLLDHQIAKKLRMRSVLSESLTPPPNCIPWDKTRDQPKLDSRICFDVAIYYWDGHRCKRKGEGFPKTTRTPAESSKKFRSMRRRGFKEGSYVFGVFGPSEGPEVVAMSPYVLQRVPAGDYS